MKKVLFGFLFIFISFFLFGQEIKIIPEVVISSKKKTDTLRIEIDTLTIKKGDNLKGLMDKIPGLIWNQGKLYYNGKSLNKIFIDGKEMYSGNSKITSEQIPAEWVKDLQITNPNNKDETSILNIGLNTKKSQKTHLNTEMLGNANDRYLVRGSVNRVRKSMLFNSFINANNLSKSILPESIAYRNFFNEQFFSSGNLLSNLHYSYANAGDLRLSHPHIGDTKLLQSGFSFNIKKTKVQYTVFGINEHKDLFTQQEYRGWQRANENTIHENTRKEGNDINTLYLISQKFNYSNLDNSLTVLLDIKRNETTLRNTQNIQNEYINNANSNAYKSLHTENSSQNTNSLSSKILWKSKIFRMGIDFVSERENSVADYTNQFSTGGSTTAQSTHREQTAQNNNIYLFYNLYKNLKNLRIETQLNIDIRHTSISREDEYKTVLSQYEIQHSIASWEAFLWYKKRKLDLIIGADAVGIRNKFNASRAQQWSRNIFPKAKISYRFSDDLSLSLSSNYKINFKEQDYLLPVLDTSDSKRFIKGDDASTSTFFSYSNSLSLSKNKWQLSADYEYLPQSAIIKTSMGASAPVQSIIIADSPSHRMNISGNYISSKPKFSQMHILIFRHWNFPIILNENLRYISQNSLNLVSLINTQVLNQNIKAEAHHSFIISNKTDYNLRLTTSSELKITPTTYLSPSLSLYARHLDKFYLYTPQISLALEPPPFLP